MIVGVWRVLRLASRRVFSSRFAGKVRSTGERGARLPVGASGGGAHGSTGGGSSRSAAAGTGAGQAAAGPRRGARSEIGGQGARAAPTGFNRWQGAGRPKPRQSDGTCWCPFALMAIRKTGHGQCATLTPHVSLRLWMGGSSHGITTGIRSYCRCTQHLRRPLLMNVHLSSPSPLSRSLRSDFWGCKNWKSPSKPGCDLLENV